MIGKPLQIIQFLYNEDKDKVFEVKEHKEKRSLNANSYAWQLMEKIAIALQTTKDDIYERMLNLYGTLYRDSEDKLLVIPSIDELVSTPSLHLKFIGKKLVNEKSMNLYAVIKGSSEYDTKEMSTFINGVVDEAKELYIETLTEKELSMLKI